MISKTFCSSPWFHVRLTYDGSFESCRWGKNITRTERFQNNSIVEFYNSKQMRLLRRQLLNGDSPDHCSTCYYEESFGKLNGRIRQLTKSAVDVNDFDLTIRSSPHYKNFKYSLDNNGLADLAPVDLQIEMGNTCNSACIMCTPEASSKLSNDYQKLYKIDPVLFEKPKSFASWTKNKELVTKLVNELINIPNLRYIHFLGGETLYEEAFYDVCEKLIEHDCAKNIIVGTTTNGTIYNDRIKKFIEHFKQFHLGISIESVTELNDYIRWPGKINDILENTDKFLQLRKSNPGLYISLRITPNVFSIWEIDKIFSYMIENQVIAESCNILYDPPHLRVELVPDDIRIKIKQKLEALINRYKLSKENIANIRRTDQINQVTANVILDYHAFICNYQAPKNVENLRYNLIDFVNAFESIRNNSILDHLPEYEKFLRHYGY